MEFEKKSLKSFVKKNVERFLRWKKSLFKELKRKEKKYYRKELLFSKKTKKNLNKS